MKRFALVLFLMLLSTVHIGESQSTKPTVSIDSNYPAVGSGAVVAFRKHVQQLTQYLQTDCGLTVTIRMDKADYLVKLTYIEWGLAHKSSKIEIANPDGDTIITMEKTKIEKDYQQVCSAILDNWSSRKAAKN